MIEEVFNESVARCIPASIIISFCIENDICTTDRCLGKSKLDQFCAVKCTTRIGLIIEEDLEYAATIGVINWKNCIEGIDQVSAGGTRPGTGNLLLSY